MNSEDNSEIIVGEIIVKSPYESLAHGADDGRHGRVGRGLLEPLALVLCDPPVSDVAELL